MAGGWLVEDAVDVGTRHLAIRTDGAIRPAFQLCKWAHQRGAFGGTVVHFIPFQSACHRRAGNMRGQPTIYHSELVTRMVPGKQLRMVNGGLTSPVTAVLAT